MAFGPCGLTFAALMIPGLTTSANGLLRVIESSTYHWFLQYLQNLVGPQTVSAESGDFPSELGLARLGWSSGKESYLLYSVLHRPPYTVPHLGEFLKIANRSPCQN